MNKMRTSTSQFELLVEFMEKHGDLGKAAEGAQGRIINIQQWTELTKNLNEDVAGNSRSVERWRKEWSVLKNKAKRKAAQFYQAFNGNSNGISIGNVTLTELELRILRVVGVHSPTGMIEASKVFLEDLQHIAELNTMHKHTPRSILVVPVHKTTENILPYTENVITENNDISTNQPMRATTLVTIPHAPIHTTQERRRQRRVEPVTPASKRIRPEVTTWESSSDNDWRTYLIQMERRNSELEAERLRLR